jgi:SAM-dependent methyltransferase
MSLDQDRLKTILNQKLSYYSRPDIRKDARLNFFTGEILAGELNSSMRVLDIGCGSGSSLLELSERFAVGVGIDNDPEHIRLAQEEKRAVGVENVDFRLIDFPSETALLGLETFDVVFSNLGPAGDSPAHIQAALKLLKPDGLLLCTEIGELHQPEAEELFGTPAHGHQVIHVGERLRMWMVECGIDIRLCADMLAKWCFKDIYDWFYYQCSIWSWLGIPLPAPDDPRIELFAQRNTNAKGEIETTHHVALVGGVKPPSA